MHNVVETHCVLTSKFVPMWGVPKGTLFVKLRTFPQISFERHRTRRQGEVFSEQECKEDQKSHKNTFTAIEKLQYQLIQ